MLNYNLIKQLVHKGHLTQLSVSMPDSVSKIRLYRLQTKLLEGHVFIPVCDSVHGVGGALSRGLCPRGLCPGGSLSKGGLCLGDLCSGNSLGCLCLGVFARKTPRTVKSGQYTSYWNAFLFSKCMLLADSGGI